MNMILPIVLILLFAAEPASAGPFAVAFALLSNGVAFGSAITAAFGTIGAFLLKSVAGFALSMLGQALQKQPKVKPQGIQTEQTTTGDTTPQKFIVGRYAAEGHAVAPAYSRGANNRILTYIIEVSNIPIEGLTGRVVIDGQWTDLTPGGDDASRLDFTDLGTDGAGNPFGWLWFFDGTQTTAFSQLVTNYGTHPDRPWTANHILAGTAFAVCEFGFDREIYSGLPSVRFEIDGIKLYDPRLDTSVGGTGTHRWADTSTWEFSQNPQVINYNILRGITLPTGDIYGGEVPAEDLPLDNWFAAMNECDVLIGSRVQYQVGFEIDVSVEPIEIIAEMNKASFAKMSEFGGVFRVRVGAPSAAVMSITDDDLIISEASNLDPFPGLRQTVNAITGTYVEPNDVWQGRSADPIYNATWETDDGGRRLPQNLDFPSVANKSQMQHLLNSYLNDARRFRVHRMALPPSYATIEPLDTISWTSARNGYTSKLFEVVNVEDRLDTMVQLVTVRERDAGDVAWETGDDVAQPAATNALTRPSALVPTLTLTALAIDDDASTDMMPVIKIAWDATVVGSEAELIKWQVRKTSSTEIVGSGAASVDSAETIVSGLARDTEYQARAQFVLGSPTAWSTWQDVTTLDVDASGAIADGRITVLQENGFSFTPRGGDGWSDPPQASDLNTVGGSPGVTIPAGFTGDIQIVVSFQHGYYDLTADNSWGLRIEGGGAAFGGIAEVYGRYLNPMALESDFVTVNVVVPNVTNATGADEDYIVYISWNAAHSATILDETAFVVGTFYEITTLGTTNWNTIAGTVGITYAIGDIFRCDATSGTDNAGRAKLARVELQECLSSVLVRFK